MGFVLEAATDIPDNFSKTVQKLQLKKPTQINKNTEKEVAVAAATQSLQ